LTIEETITHQENSAYQSTSPTKTFLEFSLKRINKHDKNNKHMYAVKE